MPAIMKTHQLKLRQSCREYRAFKADDMVVVLCITRKRQMQRLKEINQATSARTCLAHHVHTT
jgi:hypothetical protein